jgi:hypothetical protein
MSKDIWVLAYEKLESELGREPTYEEVDERCADMLAKITDGLYEDMRMSNDKNKR